LQHLELQCLGIDDAELQLLNDPVERRFGHSVKPAMSAVNSIPMPTKFATLKSDEVTAFGLRLMKSFLKLRSRAHREELIALAERMVEEEQKYPVEPGD
jgi:hypothetical protein